MKIGIKMINLKQMFYFLLVCLASFLLGMVIRIFTPPFFVGECIASVPRIKEAKIVSNDWLARKSTVHVVLFDGGKGNVIIPYDRLLNEKSTPCSERIKK